jgi:hypothetical protein
MRLLVTTLIIAFVSVFNAEAKCDFKPSVAYEIQANSNLVLAYEVQVLRKRESPNTVSLHSGLRAIYETCSESWMIRDVNIYYDALDAINAQKKWISKGYVGAFVVPTYLYIEKGSIIDVPSVNESGRPMINDTLQQDVSSDITNEANRGLLRDPSYEQGSSTTEAEKVHQKPSIEATEHFNKQDSVNTENVDTTVSNDADKLPYSKDDSNNYWLPVALTYINKKDINV